MYTTAVYKDLSSAISMWVWYRKGFIFLSDSRLCTHGSWVSAC